MKRFLILLLLAIGFFAAITLVPSTDYRMVSYTSSPSAALAAPGSGGTTFMSYLTVDRSAEKTTPTLTPKPISQKPLADPTSLGFRSVITESGLTVFSRADGSFLLLADLQKSGIDLLHGPIVGQSGQPAIWGGNDAIFRSKTLTQYLTGDKPKASLACGVNAQFFRLVEYPTRLAHPLKVNGSVVTYGWETDTVAHPDQKMMLELWSGHAQLGVLNKNGFEASSAPDILTGLTADANKKPHDAYNRTFIGLKDDRYFLALIMPLATQKQAERVLEALNVDSIMMLDGGGSSQLVCEKNGSILPLFPSDRLIPQAIVVYSK